MTDFEPEEVAAIIDNFQRKMARIGAHVSMIEVSPETFKVMRHSPISTVRFAGSQFAEVTYAGIEIRSSNK